MRDKEQIKLHDGIVGSLIFLSVILAINVHSIWILLAGAISILMIVSALTGFCPVYFLLDKTMGAKK